MGVQWTPMRWPSTWKDPASLALLNGTAIDCLLVEKRDELGPIRSRAQEAGLHVVDAAAPPAGVEIVKGEWPGVKMSRSGPAQMAAGPTGVPWVDSNGWLVRLHRALRPESSVWVEAAPSGNARISADSYLIAIADTSAHGGRWVISLDGALATGIASQKPESLDTFKKIAAAAGFFSARQAWGSFAPAGVVGVASDFAGKNEFFSHELLNLLGRAGQHYVVIPKSGSLGGLPAGVSDWPQQSVRAVIYADAEAPGRALRARILSFVEAGGMLIASPQWGEAPGKVSGTDDPRYDIRTLGKGRIALARNDPDDPYLWANDSVMLVSHRYDLVRFWNSGATASYYTVSPDRKRAVVHLLFYANRGPDAATVRIAGRYRSARLTTVERPEMPKPEMETQKDAIEVHLPQVSQYVALELET